MAEVGVRELKAELSAWLDRVAAGERVTVTNRGRPVATIAPIVDAVSLDAAIEQGWATPATAPLRPVTRRRPQRRLADVLDEDRAE